MANTLSDFKIFKIFKVLIFFFFIKKTYEVLLKKRAGVYCQVSIKVRGEAERNDWKFFERLQNLR